MAVDAWSSLDACALKMVRNKTLFRSSVTTGCCGICGELALMGSAGGHKATLRGAVKLLWARAMSFVGSITLGAGVLGVFGEKMYDFSTF